MLIPYHGEQKPAHILFVPECDLPGTVNKPGPVASEIHPTGQQGLCTYSFFAMSIAYFAVTVIWPSAISKCQLPALSSSCVVSTALCVALPVTVTPSHAFTSPVAGR